MGGRGRAGVLGPKLWPVAVGQPDLDRPKARRARQESKGGSQPRSLLASWPRTPVLPEAPLGRSLRRPPRPKLPKLPSGYSAASPSSLVAPRIPARPECAAFPPAPWQAAGTGGRGIMGAYFYSKYLQAPTTEERGGGPRGRVCRAEGGGGAVSLLRPGPARREKGAARSLEGGIAPGPSWPEDSLRGIGLRSGLKCATLTLWRPATGDRPPARRAPAQACPAGHREKDLSRPPPSKKATRRGRDQQPERGRGQERRGEEGSFKSTNTTLRLQSIAPSPPPPATEGQAPKGTGAPRGGKWGEK